jgi:hypothetical protein
MDSTRSHALSQIMLIENQVKRINISKRYMKIQKYVHDLKDHNGKAILDIEDPEDMGKVIKIRKNSSTAKKYLKQYELLLYEYQVLFNELHKQKDKFKKQLFG